MSAATASAALRARFSAAWRLLPLPPSLLSAAIAATTWALFRICRTKVRRCDRSGPSAATFWLRNLARSRRAVRRLARLSSSAPSSAAGVSTRGGRGGAFAISSQARGSPICTRMSRRVKTKITRRRKRDDIAQPSESSERVHDRSLFAARPQKMETGTSHRRVALGVDTSSSPAAPAASFVSTRRKRDGTVRITLRRHRPAGSVRKKKLSASSRWSTAARGFLRPLRSATMSSNARSAAERLGSA